MIEPKELLTKRRIEKLAAQYADENLDVISRRGEREYDVFVSHSIP